MQYVIIIRKKLKTLVLLTVKIEIFFKYQYPERACKEAELWSIEENYI